ncbi:MAG: right-handed parallel beta-helix repeat-containing protein, partial [Deltaproteobacteria bacterium]|nr:right-handed parallel beta-helix repeat-containing protein [Deltaproteobacteria bacterium]
FDQVDEYVAGSVLEHCILEQGARAVQTEAASPFLFRAAFQDNAFSPSLAEGGAALYIGPGSAPRVAECTFEDNAVGGSGQGGAIYVDDANPVLQDNVFRGNTSTYGGALTTFAMYAPIVGNTFEDNHSAWEGGAVALVSSSPAFLNNRVVDNDTILDGGGVHVCVTCYPHAFPFVMDNVITGNHNVGHGAAGLGSAHLRVFSHNDIHDNFMGTEPADFAWHNAEFDIAPSWVRDPAIPHKAPTARPTTRVTITTRKYRYFDDGEQMPVFLTLYNPGPAREVELAVLLQYGDGAPIYYRDDVGFPEAELSGDTWRLELPENAAWYGELMAPAWRDEPAFPYGTWHAALFDPDSGAPIGDLVSARFELGELVE